MAKYSIRKSSHDTPIQVYGYKLTAQDKLELPEHLAIKLLENNTTAKYLVGEGDSIEQLKQRIAQEKADKAKLAAKPPTAEVVDGAEVSEKEPSKTKK